jgi:repressor LexA
MISRENKTRQYLTKLKRFYFKQKRMPSYGELTELLKFKSKNAAQYLVNKWLEAGIIQKDKNGKILPGKAFNPIKVLGTVAAGWPSPAEEENADTISLDDWLIENKEASFMLKVRGDSMIDAGIMPGDMVILERGRQPKNGDVVVAEVDRDWTIKYFEQTTQQEADSQNLPQGLNKWANPNAKNRHLILRDNQSSPVIRLIAANKKYPPIVPKEELRIAGVVTAVIRKM